MAKKQTTQEMNKRAKALAYSKTKASAFKSKFREHASTAIIAAFGFVIAIVWKDLIVKIVDDLFKPEILQKYPYIGMLVSALIVTTVAIIGIALVTKYFKEEEKKE